MQEHEFILNYARTNPEEIRSLSNFNWQYVLSQAKAHNVAPLLYYNIKNLLAPLEAKPLMGTVPLEAKPLMGTVPAAALKELEKIYTYTAFHNMLYLEELNRILEKVKNIIILKGPALAQDVYGNIGLRPFSDMDILVKKEELDEIKSILCDMGYLTDNESFYKKYHFHMPLVKMDKIPIHLELHWAFVDKFILQKIDMDKIWKGIKENTLPPEINILYLLLHIEKHAFFNKAIYNSGNPRDWIFIKPLGNQLIWYADIYETIKKYKIDWQRLITFADEWCIQNIVYYNLYILNKLYPISSLENLPQPRLSLPKKLIYIFASKKTEIKLQADMQLRPIRAVDLVNYLFPPGDILKKYYCKTTYIPAIIVHLFTGLKEILSEFFGICHQKLSTRKKKESQAVN